MKEGQSKLKVGDSVVVKPGTKDPDTGSNISGWQGRITKVDHLESQVVVMIEWDSITLKNTPISVIKSCEREGLDWRVMGLGADDVQPVASRDSELDVENTVEEIEKQVCWAYLGKEGERIQKVLDGIDPDDEMAVVEVWEEHLGKKLRFPFEAEVSEPQDRGQLRIGDRVKVKSISMVDDMYGIIVDVQRGEEPFAFPLCDLEVTNKASANYQVLRDYVVWFANR